jgi:hypothetical protein
MRFGNMSEVTAYSGKHNTNSSSKTFMLSSKDRPRKTIGRCQVGMDEVSFAGPLIIVAQSNTLDISTFHMESCGMTAEFAKLFDI